MTPFEVLYIMWVGSLILLVCAGIGLVVDMWPELKQRHQDALRAHDARRANCIFVPQRGRGTVHNPSDPSPSPRVRT